MREFVAKEMQITGQRGYCKPNGKVSLNEAALIVTGAIEYSRNTGLKELLVNLSGLTGFRLPSVGERYFFVEQWAATARGQIRFALVAPAELIDRNKFGTLVAKNRGFDADIFASEADASRWLDSRL